MPSRDYYLKHREELLKYGKKYYQDNKDKIDPKRYEKIQCRICGGSFCISNKIQHSKTKKHQNMLKILQDNYICIVEEQHSSLAEQNNEIEVI